MRTSSARLLGLFLIALTGIAGCRSFSSTMLERDPGNTGWSKQRQLRGIPVTLKVPTHVRVDIEETHFLCRQGDNIRTTRIRLDRPIRKVAYSFILGEKIFMVDFKRPGAGVIDSTIDFVGQKDANAETQYFDKIESTVTDETIEKTAQLINTLGTRLLSGTGTTAVGEEISKRVRVVHSVVATQVFELDSPCFEQEIGSFLDHHLNHCHDCSLVTDDVQDPTLLDQHSPSSGSDVTAPGTHAPPSRTRENSGQIAVGSDSTSDEPVVSSYFGEVPDSIRDSRQDRGHDEKD